MTSIFRCEECKQYFKCSYPNKECFEEQIRR